MEIKLPEVEAAGGPSLVRRRKVQITETANLQRWIVRLHLVNRSLRLLRFVLMRLRGRSRRFRGLLFWQRRRGRARRGQHRRRGSRLPRLQLRDSLFQLLNALKQYPDLLCLIRRGRTLPPSSACSETQDCAQQ